MHVQTLDVLRCPFCGSQPSLVDNGALVRTSTHIESGVLGCECCAFPIVAGIPVMIADDVTRTAMHRLEAGDAEGALFGLLGLGDAPSSVGQTQSRGDAFRSLLRGDAAMTYRRAISVLSPDAEGEYFVYRFSDPTFLLASATIEALARHPQVRARKALDLCGGSGHLTRELSRFLSPEQTMLADVFFWKLWLARRFTSPGCEAVCCDANQPLPFARSAFSLVVCSDALNYIWQKHLVAEEMMRLAGEDGILALPHLHSAMGYNFSAGMPLTPRAYRDLFAPLGARLFRESVLSAQVLDGKALDLGNDAPLDTIGDEPSLMLIATRLTDVFRSHEPHDAPAKVTGTLTVNPLYSVERRDNVSVLTLSFPTAAYAEEFSVCKRYLPATVTVPADLTRPFDPSALGSDYAELRKRHVIIDAPLHYC